MSDELVKIPLKEIFADEKFNCRGRISPIDVIDLWKSIEQMGLIQPITVRQLEKPTENGEKYQLVAGYRRYMAHVVGKQEVILSRIVTCSQEEAEILNITENLQRKELNLLQEANAVERFHNRGWTQDRIAKELKVSRTWVINRLKLLSLPEDIQKEAESGLINQSHIAVLFEMKSQEEQFETVKKIKEAAEKGDKLKAKALKEEKDVTPPDVAPKRTRARKEMFDMIDYVMTKVGGCLATRALAWAAGEVSDDEFKKDLEG